MTGLINYPPQPGPTGATGPAGSPDTATEVKTKLESNSDTNTVNDAEKIALGRLENRISAQSYIDAIETADISPMSDIRKAQLADLIAGLKTANAFYGHSFRVLQGPSTLDGIFASGQGGTVTNSGFVDADVDEYGLTGDGTAKYLQTDWAGNAQGQDDFCVSIYVTRAVTDSADNKAYYGNTTGGASGSIQLNKSTSDKILTRAKATMAKVSTLDASDVTGLISMSRGSSTQYRVRLNGTTETYTTTTDDNLATPLRFFSRLGDSFADASLSFISYGPALSDAETILLESALDTYRTGSLLATIGFGSDLHYGRKATYSNRYPQDGDEKLADAIAVWDSEPLDAIVINGDLIDHLISEGTEATEDLTEAVADLTAANAQVYYAMGNHEFDVLTRAQILAINGQSAGHTYFDVGTKCRVVILDPSYGSNDDSDGWVPGVFDYQVSYIPPDQRVWLANTLDTSMPCLVFCHYRLTDQNAAHNVANATAVRTILEAAGNVKAVFSGHSHVNLKTVINSIPYFVMQAMTEGADPTNAYAILRLYENTIEVEGFGGQTTYSEILTE